MNSEEVLGFFKAVLSENEFYLKQLKRRYSQREMPLKPTVTYSPPDGGKLEFQEIVEQYYLPWLPTEEQLGYEIFKQALFSNEPILRIAGKFNVDTETARTYLDYFTNAISKTIPFNIYQQWSGEIRGALRVGHSQLNPRNYVEYGMDGIECAACDDVEFEKAMELVKPQIHFVVQKYGIWGFDKEDIRQICLIALNKALAHFDPKQTGGHFKTYFQLLAENNLKNEISKSQAKHRMALNKAIMGDARRHRIGVDELDIPRKSPNGDGEIMLARLLDFMTGLPPDARSVLVWRLRGLELKAIAKKLKKPMGQIEILSGQINDIARFVMNGLEKRAEKLQEKRNDNKGKHRMPIQKSELKTGVEITLKNGKSLWLSNGKKGTAAASSQTESVPVQVGKLDLKPGSLFDAIVRSIFSHNRFEEHDAIFSASTGSSLVAQIGVPYRTLLREVAYDKAYLNRLERLKELAAEGSKRAQSKLDRTHGERMREAMYLMSMSGTSATNKNAQRFKRAGLTFKRANIGEDEMLFLIRSKHLPQLEAALLARR